MSAPPLPAVSVCVVGSGPSGLYAVDAIARKRPDAAIDVLDRLPTPFGLVRAGVAPDHLGTKNIVRQFDRALSRPGIRFLGNVAVGRDLSLDELKAIYDAVILAVGAPLDRPLGVPGETLAGVYGSGAFVGWYNGHPDHAALAPRLPGPSVAVIGNGNVALDIARILAKTPEEMADSDLCAHAAEAITAAPITDIHIIGRRGPVEAAFTSVELAELGQLQRARPVVNAAALENLSTEAETDPRVRKVKERNLEILREFADRPDGGEPVRLHLHFHAAPCTVLDDGSGCAAGLRLERTQVKDGRAIGTGTTFDLPATTIITAIGYRCAAVPGLPMDESRGIIANEEGCVETGVYVTGWARRGPSGVIPTNRSDALAVAGRVLADLETVVLPKPGPDALDSLLTSRAVRPVCYADWQKIEAAEVARAAKGRPREKFIRVEDMLAALGPS